MVLEWASCLDAFSAYHQPNIATQRCPRTGQLVHQRLVPSGPLVLGRTLLTFPRLRQIGSNLSCDGLTLCNAHCCASILSFKRCRLYLARGPDFHKPQRLIANVKYRNLFRYLILFSNTELIREGRNQSLRGPQCIRHCTSFPRYRRISEYRRCRLHRYELSLCWAQLFPYPARVSL